MFARSKIPRLIRTAAACCQGTSPWSVTTVKACCAQTPLHAKRSEYALLCRNAPACTLKASSAWTASIALDLHDELLCRVDSRESCFRYRKVSTCALQSCDAHACILHVAKMHSSRRQLHSSFTIDASLLSETSYIHTSAARCCGKAAGEVRLAREDGLKINESLIAVLKCCLQTIGMSSAHVGHMQAPRIGCHVEKKNFKTQEKHPSHTIF